MFPPQVPQPSELVNGIPLIQLPVFVYDCGWFTTTRVVYVRSDTSSTTAGSLVNTPQEWRVCVYCASSRGCAAVYHDTAYRLGALLASHNHTIVYGGGGVGSMAALADGALSKGGQIVGVLPRFMADLEWGHNGLSELKVVEDLRSRKHLMLSDSNAVVAMPGGSGTLEELLEAITLKRLGIFLGPIVLVNTERFFDPLVELLATAIERQFMDQRHERMWQLVSEPEEVPEAFAKAPVWSEAARGFATV